MYLTGILLYEQDYALEMAFSKGLILSHFFPHQPPAI